MAQQSFEAGNPENYTIGGVIFLFNRNIDLTTAPVQREGFKDMGNVVTATDEQGVDVLDHFTSRSGTRRKDRSLVREITDEILLTLDELNAENIRMMFRSGDVTEIVASTANTGTREVMKLDRTEARIIGGYNAGSAGNAAAIIVKDEATDTVTYVLNTDYSVEKVIGDYYAIRRIPAGGIADGELVLVDFDFDVRKHKLMKPGTKLEVTGQGLFMVTSDTGNEFTRTIAKVQVEPEGAFDVNDEDWSEFQIRMKILDNSSVVGTEPFGTLEHYEVGSNLT